MVRDEKAAQNRACFYSFLAGVLTSALAAWLIAGLL